MASPQVNENIGHIECSECGALGALRRNKSDDLYYDCLECGRISPNHAGGQKRLRERAHFWPADGPPADVPRWIAEQWSYAYRIKHRDEAVLPREASAQPTPEPAASETVEIPDTPPPPPEKPEPVKPAPAPARIDDDEPDDDEDDEEHGFLSWV